MKELLGFANLNTVETAIAQFKGQLTSLEASKGVRRNPAHLRALRYIRDCRLENIEPSPIRALNIARGREQ